MLEMGERKRKFFGKIIREWEDLGVCFSKGEILQFDEAKFFSEFYYYGTHVIPKKYIEEVCK